MNSNDRFVADSFLASVENVDFRNPEPDHVVERRARLASMVLSEIEPDDIVSMALLSLASAALQMCVISDCLDTMSDYVKAKRAYAEAVVASNPL